MAHMSDDEFVRIWNNAGTRQEVAETCEVSGASVGMRAAKLRAAGVNLKYFARGRPKKSIDVKKLNQIINEMDNVV